MNQFPNKKDRIVVLVLWLIFFTTAVSFDLFLLAFQDIGTILTAILTSLITIFLTHLIKIVSKGFFLKYYFNKKEYKKLYKESVKKFKDADEEFIKEFKRRTLFHYNSSGKLFTVLTIEDDKWLLSSKDNLIGLSMLINLLDNAIINQTGFNGFIDEAFKLTHNGELVMQTLENGFTSGELRYLFFVVYLLTDYNLSDNELNIEYTNKVNSIRKELSNRYDPILKGFVDEIEELKDKLLEHVAVKPNEKENLN